MTLLLRLNKAAPLTNAEADDNLIYLDSRITTLESTKLSHDSLLNAIKEIDGAGSGIDADKLHALTPTDQNVYTSIVARDAAGNFHANQITANLIGNASSATEAASISGTLPVNRGGTGASSLQPGYVKNLGSIFTITQSIPGADISGDILGYAANVTGTVAIANGGTGGTTISSAQLSLGLVIGQTVQAYNHNLQSVSQMSIAGLVTRTSSGIFLNRSITIGDCLKIANADATAGNPFLELSVVDITHGGTGATTAATACAAIGAVNSISGTMSGTPTAPTATFGTKTTQIATTEFVINNGVPTGSILFMALLQAPMGFLLANGNSYHDYDYPTLYASIGIRYGVGNGNGTFKVPVVIAPAGLIAVIKI